MPRKIAKRKQHDIAKSAIMFIRQTLLILGALLYMLGKVTKSVVRFVFGAKNAKTVQRYMRKCKSMTRRIRKYLKKIIKLLRKKSRSKLSKQKNQPPKKLRPAPVPIKNRFPIPDAEFPLHVSPKSSRVKQTFKYKKI